MSDRPLVLLGDQAQGLVERVSSAQGTAHGIQRIREAFLKLSETFATVTRNFQQWYPEHSEAHQQCHPPD
ncbi:hypothetical protein D3C84_1102700 [compost metagenome]